MHDENSIIFLRSLCALLIPLITVASHPFLSLPVPLPDSVLLAKGDHTLSTLSPLSPPDFDPAVCPHNHQSTEIVRQLTATQSGLKQRACLDCGNVLEEKTISTLTIETGINPAPLPDYEYKDIFKRNRYVFAAVAAWVKTQ